MNLAQYTDDQLKSELTEFRAGDTVKVHTRIKEGEKVRVQIFEGVVLKRSKGVGIRGNFTVRRIANGVGVERTFFLHSPNVIKIEKTRSGKVRRARLYYLRDIKGTSMKIKQDESVFKKKTKVKAPQVSKQTVETTQIAESDTQAKAATE